LEYVHFNPVNTVSLAITGLIAGTGVAVHSYIAIR
jgi:hypothetical protein